MYSFLVKVSRVEQRLKDDDTKRHTFAVGFQSEKLKTIVWRQNPPSVSRAINPTHEYRYHVEGLMQHD
jgi:hypothetical protein